VGGLYFDGTNDFVTFGPASGLGVSNFTVEAWFRRLSPGATTGTGTGGVTAVPLVAKGRGESDGSNLDMNFFLGIRGSDGVLAADFEDLATGTNHPVVGTTTVTNTTNWQHAAVTYDGTNWALYLNGQLNGTASGGGATPRYDSIQHAALGSALTSTGAAAGFFDGVLDEVRLWSHARTAAQISNDFQIQITNATGLIARWSLDETNGTTVTNSGTSGVNGTMTNGPVPAAGYPWGSPLPTFVINTLTATGSFWKYRDTGTNLSTAWVAPAFDDSAWKTGPAQLGYGDGDEATTVSYGGVATNKFITTYFRRAFNAANVGAYTSLTLRAIRDDGIAVYLNGTEVFRNNLAPGANYTNRATANVGGSDESTFYSTNVNPALLVEGNNVLAVEIHQDDPSSSDISFELELKGVQTFIDTNVPPQVTLTAPANGAVFAAPADITLNASATDADGVTKVEFFAAGAKVGEDTNAPFSFLWSSVPAGTNALFAVASDGLGATNSSETIHIRVIDPATAQLTRGPYLQMSTPTSIVIRWRTELAADSRVVYGTNSGSLNLTNILAAAVTEHEITLTNLLPDTRYYYSIASSFGTLAGPGTNYFFLTHPLPGTPKPTRVWVIGDAGTATASQTAVRNGFDAFNGTNLVHLWLQLGDNAYSSGTDGEYQAAVFNMYSNLLGNSVTWPALGNHDTGGSTTFSTNYPYFAMFNLPTNAQAGGVASGVEHYYSFDYGMIHFICLDSMTSSRATNGAMADWLRMDLMMTTSRWVVAYWHHPPYTKGSHNSDSVSDSDGSLVEMRGNFLPILEAGGVDLVLTGHSHSYERSFFIDRHYGFSSGFAATNIVQAGSGRETNGTGAYLKPANSVGAPVGNRGAIYAVAGSSGQTSGGSLDHAAMFISLNVLGSMVLDVTSNRLDAVFLREAGAGSVSNDWFSIIKTPTNQAPVASNLTFNLPADSPANFFLAGSDPEGAAISYISNSAAARGLITGFTPASGAFTYRPAHGFTGGDSFTFRVSDGTNTSAAATVTLNVQPLPDANANGIPDAWEAQFGISSATADPDADGQNNLQEYWANTNPTNWMSFLRPPTVTRLSNGFYRLEWDSVGGTRYRVKYSNGSTNTGYDGSFIDLVRAVTLEMDPAPDGIPGTNSFTDNFSLTGPPSQAWRFYRIEVVR